MSWDSHLILGLETSSFDMSRVDYRYSTTDILGRGKLSPERSRDRKSAILTERPIRNASPISQLIQKHSLFMFEQDSLLPTLLNDKGVDAGGLGVEEVGDGSL